MSSAATDPLDPGRPAPDAQTPEPDDIVHECGLESFPASDPPSWWGAA